MEIEFDTHSMYVRKINEAAEYLRNKLDTKPKIAIILGSGLGPLVGEIKEPQIIDYSEIPHFPLATVQGHAGYLVSGKLEGKDILVMSGRFHYYEGYDMQQVSLPIRVFKKTGIDNLLVTNAAGGINTNFEAGALMVITDHIGFNAPSALIGRNLDEFGPRFPDMTDVYTKSLRGKAFEAAKDVNPDMHIYNIDNSQDNINYAVDSIVKLIEKIENT